ncbi:MAG TPA: coproporphyrinogen-III oxidase family protein [Candidatus Limnocylindrales bacterium]|nr:coproporphyrinogen-III oxidase family protein [Candidatus Limnocylindrales bacterium]
MAGPPVGLYVHVPFCLSICPYCDFVVHAGSDARGPRSRVPAYLRAVRTEIELRADVLDDRFGPPGATGRPALETLYLGGGTPSLLPAADVAALIELVRERFGLAAGTEITLEANPGPSERGDLAAFADAGVTRLSVGAQALEASTLRRLGRRHAPSDVTDTVAEARAAGIGSVGLDLLYDLPGQTVAGWAATLEAALDLRPEHLSLYALGLDDPDAEGLTEAGGDHLPVRPGARRWRDRARAGQDEDRAAAMYEHAVDHLQAAGFRGYEISNWARPGHESRHNLAYWRRLPVEAVGPGAHAFDGETRRWNAARLETYLAALVPPSGRPPSLPPGGSERLAPSAARAETIVLGLRTAEGISARAASEAAVEAGLRWGIEHALLVERSGRLALTTTGRLLSNELFARLV